ncbi:MAG: FxsA family protein [Myxococcales bacterium]|nr:FxsA family protein [Myxococcales bacterium]
MLALALFLAFTVIPALETYLLIEVGRQIGGWSTVGWLVAMGLLGSVLGKRAGSGVLRQISDDLRSGRSPADSVVEGALVLVGSVLLVTPGILSDVVGVLLFIQPLRRSLAPRLKAVALGWLSGRSGGLSWKVGSMGPGPGAAPPAANPERLARGFDHPSS